MKHVNQAIQGSWAESTIKHYTGSIKHFICFCDSKQVLDSLHFPTDKFVLCAFIASSLGRHAGNTSHSHISALKAWHITHNMEWKGSSHLRYVLNSVHNLAPGSSKQPLHPPPLMWRQLHNWWRSSTSIPHLMQWLLPVWPLPSETMPPWQTSAHLLLILTHHFPSQMVRFQEVPTKPSFMCSLPPSHQNPPPWRRCCTCWPMGTNQPNLWVKNDLWVNNIPNNTYIFSVISGTDNSLTSLSKSSFLQCCNAIWHWLGYPRTTGHHFCIGGTTELLIAGTPPDIIRATSWWSSESFLQYWHSLDNIAPWHIHYLHTIRKPCKHSQ